MPSPSARVVISRTDEPSDDRSVPDEISLGAREALRAGRAVPRLDVLVRPDAPPRRDALLRCDLLVRATDFLAAVVLWEVLLDFLDDPLFFFGMFRLSPIDCEGWSAQTIHDSWCL
jgi:hypothetical protein